MTSCSQIFSAKALLQKVQEMALGFDRSNPRRCGEVIDSNPW